jgi:hypothetical protein
MELFCWDLLRPRLGLGLNDVNVRINLGLGSCPGCSDDRQDGGRHGGFQPQRLTGPPVRAH